MKNRATLLILLLPLLLLACGAAGTDDADDAEAVPQRATAVLAPAPDLPGRQRLEAVSHWLYMIDVNLDEATIDEMVASQHDMVVLDFIPSEQENRDFPMADTIAHLAEAEHPKLVIAYIDIGQAESYRTYWQSDWRVGNPTWIAGEDPDGWAENYPVAYWHDAWREIWLGEQGYLQQIVSLGFDGIYLDWVEAYSDERVAAIAAAEGVDPVQEMIWFIEDMSTLTRDLDEDFIIIGQNAAELAVDDDYVAVVDAIAQEQVWFDGGADNDPPGDCPLPATEADIDSDAYVSSLSGPCRRQWRRYPDSTLHVSSAWYLDDLSVAQARGLVIFTVDYALEPANVAWVYETSRNAGFVPFVGNRALDGFVPVYP